MIPGEDGVAVDLSVSSSTISGNQAGFVGDNKGSSPLTIDQRDEKRPVLYPDIPNSTAVGANGADMGAFELQYTKPPPPPPPVVGRAGSNPRNT